MPETALATIETINAVDLFKDEVIDPLLARIRVEALEAASALDISTPDNRAALKSLAFKVTKSRTFVEGQRVDLVAAEKKRLAGIDKRAKMTKDYLQTLEDEVRKPLTDWEQIDKDRIKAHEEELRKTEFCGTASLANWMHIPAEEIRGQIALLESDTRDYEEFRVRYAGVRALALKQMAEALEKREAYDAEQAELARLRQANIERETREREERIAREATEKAERAAAEREAQAKRDVESADQRARQAEESRKAAEERAEREAVYEKEQAEAKIHRAIQAEKLRAENARIAEEKAKAAREADREHRKAKNTEILSDLQTNANLSVFLATRVLEALAAGEIRNVTIAY